MMELVDSHSHLFLEEFTDDLPQVIMRAKAAGITHVFMPNIDSTTVEPMLKVCADYKGYCFPMIGLHPTSVNAGYRKELEVVERCLHDSRYVAIGEVGIDLYWEQTFLKEQLTVFEKQIEWALSCDLPLVIHCREAFEYVYGSLQKYDGIQGIWHSFMGTAEEAARIVETTNLLIGVNGSVTFKKSTLPFVLPHVPLSRIVLETDAPYLSPVPNRGKRNESANLLYTLQKVAEIYAEPIEKVAQVTTRNALNVFSRSEESIETFCMNQPENEESTCM